MSARSMTLETVTRLTEPQPKGTVRSVFELGGHAVVYMDIDPDHLDEVHARFDDEFMGNAEEDDIAYMRSILSAMSNVIKLYPAMREKVEAQS